MRRMYESSCHNVFSTCNFLFPGYSPVADPEAHGLNKGGVDDFI